MSTRATYESSTGLLLIHTPLPARLLGYAGRARGRNNPAFQDVRNIGPIPEGTYAVSLPFTHPTKGPTVFRLTPDPANVMFGRSGFLIHGDNPQGDASQGCIVLRRDDRERLMRSNVRTLLVVRLLPCIGSAQP